MKKSVWESESFFAPADVAIVGGGLLGLWTARELKMTNPKLKVTLIDAGATPAGASTRNAGFACFGSPSELLSDAQQNEDAMWQTVEWRFKGIEKMKALFQPQTIDYTPCGGFECYDGLAASAPSIEAVAWLNAGLRQITQEENTFTMAKSALQMQHLSGFNTLINNTLEGALHSGKLVQTLQQLVMASGVHYISSTAVSQYQMVGGCWQLWHKEHPLLMADRVVFAINGFSGTLFPELGVVPARGQMLLTPPIKGLALSGTFHFDEGFYYWRNLGDRILLGGARNRFFDSEATTEMETTAEVQLELFRFLQAHLPQSHGIALNQCQSWAG
ncbi:MAG: FAD-binding oxidoreductase, partial [Bacteroidetes bacterium]